MKARHFNVGFVICGNAKQHSDLIQKDNGSIAVAMIALKSESARSARRKKRRIVSLRKNGRKRITIQTDKVNAKCASVSVSVAPGVAAGVVV